MSETTEPKWKAPADKMVKALIRQISMVQTRAYEYLHEPWALGYLHGYAEGVADVMRIDVEHQVHMRHRAIFDAFGEILGNKINVDLEKPATASSDEFTGAHALGLKEGRIFANSDREGKGLFTFMSRRLREDGVIK